MRKSPLFETLAAFGTFLVIATSLQATHVAKAQTAANEFIISWSSDTYVPPGFVGKRLPTSGSNVNAWIALISGGKPASMANENIQWYAGSQLLQSGKGLVKISFKAPAGENNIIVLQAQVHGLSGVTKIASIQVPVISPKVAIQTDVIGATITSPSLVAKALPYFFNVSDPSMLSFRWSANGVTAQSAEDPSEADISLGGTPTGSPISLSLTVTNPSDKTSGTGTTKLIYQKI